MVLVRASGAARPVMDRAGVEGGDATGRQRSRARSEGRSVVRVALAGVMLLACADRAAEAPPADTGPVPAAALPAPAVFRIAVTAEDSLIFDQTMAWARRERLDTLEIGPLVAALGRRFVGEPYEPGTLDPPGPERLVVNLRTFDCVTFVENALAMARALRAGEPAFDAYTRELLRIRYRNGEPPGYPARLHYFSEWIAANDAHGVVENITPALGGIADPEPIDFMSAHQASYRQLEDTSNLRAIRAVEIALTERGRVYIPEDRIADVASEIRDGDIIAATSTVAGLDIAHTGIALWVNGALHLMHAPLVGSVVEISAQPLAERILRIDGQDGIMVARPL